MDNIVEDSNTVDVSVDNFGENRIIKKEDEQISFFNIKENYGFIERNLGHLPFISLKRKKVAVLNRTWVRSDGQEVMLKVVGGEDGVPQMKDMDVLLALLKLNAKQQDNRLKKTDTSVEINRKIYFTYSELARELGLELKGGSMKARLEKSIKKLNESTIYNKFAFKDASSKEYVKTFKGEKSCRILKNYTSYEMCDITEKNGKYLSPKEIKDMQYVEIDDFFYENMCHNYFKTYNFDMYLSLKMDIAKKIFLILNIWSKGNSKFITYQTLFDYIGLDIETPGDQYYAINQIKKAMKELVLVKYIDNYNEEKGRGIDIIFNQKKLDIQSYKNYYKTTAEQSDELRSYGLNVEQLGLILNNFSKDYIAGVLRCVRYKMSKGGVMQNVKNYIMSAFGKEKWDVEAFI